jgi:hypothetical protein
MRGNDELTAAEIKQKLSDEFGVDISVATIKRESLKNSYPNFEQKSSDSNKIVKK